MKIFRWPRGQPARSRADHRMKWRKKRCPERLPPPTHEIHRTPRQQPAGSGADVRVPFGAPGCPLPGVPRCRKCPHPPQASHSRPGRRVAERAGCRCCLSEPHCSCQSWWVGGWVGE
jgi:hypothetical protein